MSERIFESNGLYITSVAQPNHQGPALEFCAAGQNPRLEEQEVRKLIIQLAEWVKNRALDRRKLKLTDQEFYGEGT